MILSNRYTGIVLLGVICILSFLIEQSDALSETHIPVSGLTIEKQNDNIVKYLIVNFDGITSKCENNGWSGSNERCDMAQIMQRQVLIQQNIKLIQQNDEIINQLKLGNCLKMANWATCVPLYGDPTK